MGLRSVTQSTDLLLDLDEVKSHLRIDVDDDDAYLQGLISSVTRKAQRITNRQLIGATLELTLDEFPADAIYLPRPPAVAVESIQYRDHVENLQELDEGDYQVDAKSEPGRIVPISSWPATSSQILSVIVTYQAGYETLPDDLAHDLKQVIGTLYQNREASSDQQTNRIIQVLLSDYRFTDARVKGFSL